MTCKMLTDDLTVCSNITESEVCDEHKCKTIYSETCNICLNELNEYVYIKCGHSFHKECVEKWLLEHNTCPCCRMNVKQLIGMNENEYNINLNILGPYRPLSVEFINWFESVSNMLIHNIHEISIFNLILLLNNQNEYNYFTLMYDDIMNNRINDLSIMSNRLNTLANYLRYVNENMINDNDVYDEVNELDENINMNENNIEEDNDVYDEVNEWQQVYEIGDIYNLNDIVFTHFE